MTLKKFLVAIGVFLVSGVIVSALWNTLCVPLFGLPPMNYLQTLGILIICNMLFKPHFNTDTENN
jgi:hypothetical protein